MWGPIVYGKLGDNPQAVAKLKAERDALPPTGEQGTPWDCALCAVYLASDESRYVNGQIIQVDGGYSVVTP
jgi:NAD(P)-dependent dehydrogenase (short-subunit alcohol dehydrogenase family)|eukprot:COSAG03_NODE_1764_length_3553_cov_2.965547_2_plen_71_part_00